MFKKIKSVVYKLKDKKKTNYIGLTNNPKRRAQEHKKSGKKFSTMKIISKRVSRSSANKKEDKALSTYRKNNKGKNPKYNKYNK